MTIALPLADEFSSVSAEPASVIVRGSFVVVPANVVNSFPVVAVVQVEELFVPLAYKMAVALCAPRFAVNDVGVFGAAGVESNVQAASCVCADA